MVSFEEFLGVKEAKTNRFIRAVLAEAIGTAMLVIIGCGSVSTLQPVDTIAVAFAFGFALAMIIWLFGHISGAHVNPCVSIGFLVTGHVSLIKTVCYIVAQIAGAIAGAGLLRAVIPSDRPGQVTLASTTISPGVTLWQAVIIEIIATFCLVMTVFASCDRLRTDHSGSIALAIGFCVTCQIAWMGTLTGGSMNPARSLGPAVVTGTWDDHWVYWVATIFGGTVAALLYEHVFAEQNRETSSELQTFEYNNLTFQSEGYLNYTIDIPPPYPIEEAKPNPLEFNKGRRFSIAPFFFRNKESSNPTSPTEPGSGYNKGRRFSLAPLFFRNESNKRRDSNAGVSPRASTSTDDVIAEDA